MVKHIDLLGFAAALPQAWNSAGVGRVGGAAIKIVRMDATAYPVEVHAFDEALVVLEGRMNLQVGDSVIAVNAGEGCIVPAGVAHAVAEGSRGTLVIVDAVD